MTANEIITRLSVKFTDRLVNSSDQRFCLDLLYDVPETDVSHRVGLAYPGYHFGSNHFEETHQMYKGIRVDLLIYSPELVDSPEYFLKLRGANGQIQGMPGPITVQFDKATGCFLANMDGHGSLGPNFLRAVPGETSVIEDNLFTWPKTIGAAIDEWMAGRPALKIVRVDQESRPPKRVHF